jgi:hypothetical protein
MDRPRVKHCDKVRIGSLSAGDWTLVYYSAGVSVHYYLELDPKIADAYFESTAFPKASDQLLAIEKAIGIPSHFEFFSYSAQNHLCPPEHRETVVPWHEPQVGLDWLDAVCEYIRDNWTSIADAPRLLGDFAELRTILDRAKAQGSKWHFAMDI